MDATPQAFNFLCGDITELTLTSFGCRPVSASQFGIYSGTCFLGK